MNVTLNHEKLRVYQDALAFCAEVERLSADWEARHAVADHLPRAAESVVENIADACATRSLQPKQESLVFAMGSVLECAACVDVAAIKQLLPCASASVAKERAAHLFAMLMALRRGWENAAVRETPPSRETAGSDDQAKCLFHHERLDVYQAALTLVNWFFLNHATATVLTGGTWRRLDSLSTSIVLNLAEGNARFSTPDQQRFINLSHRAAIKMGAQLDICVARGVLPQEQVTTGKTILARIASMSYVLMSGDREDMQGYRVEAKIDNRLGQPFTTNV